MLTTACCLPTRPLLTTHCTNRHADQSVPLCGNIECIIAYPIILLDSKQPIQLFLILTQEQHIEEVTD